MNITFEHVREGFDEYLVLELSKINCDEEMDAKELNKNIMESYENLICQANDELNLLKYEIVNSKIDSSEKEIASSDIIYKEDVETENVGTENIESENIEKQNIGTEISKLDNTESGNARLYTSGMEIRYKTQGYKAFCKYMEEYDNHQDYLVDILLKIIDEFSKVSEYMLRTEGVFLNFENLYINQADMSVRLIYVPVIRLDVKDDMRVLFEEIVKVMNHDSGELVDAVYEAYQLMLNDNYDISQVRKRLSVYEAERLESHSLTSDVEQEGDSSSNDIENYNRNKGLYSSPDIEEELNLLDGKDARGETRNSKEITEKEMSKTKTNLQNCLKKYEISKSKQQIIIATSLLSIIIVSGIVMFNIGNMTFSGFVIYMLILLAGLLYLLSSINMLVKNIKA